MLDPLFSEAFVHAPGGHSILGRKLHPLCAMDLLVLEAVNSPFLIDGNDVTAGVEDLILFIWVVSNDHPKDGSVGSLELDDAGKKWLEAIKGQVDMDRDCAAVGTFFKDYWSVPEMMRDVAENPLTPYGAPWMMRHVIMAARYLRVSLYEAWTMPIGQLIWYCCAIEESEASGSRIVGMSMREKLEEAKKSYQIVKPESGESEEAFCARIGVSVSSYHAMQRTAKGTGSK